jgi:uncharacterized membrane-anchored protein
MATLPGLDNTQADGDLLTMMFGMGFIGIIVVVLAVLGIVALLKYVL